MPIKDKIELLTPEERKEWEYLNVKIRKGMCNDEEKSRWVYFRRELNRERLMNMTPEELAEAEAHDSALEAKAKYMEEHGVLFY